MKNQNITFQQFLERLKTIDVGELLDKAKSIKVEDIKSMKFSDFKEITKSTYFYPSLGISFAAIASIALFFPSLEALKNRQSKSLQYKDESKELPIIKDELIRRNKANIIFESKYNDFIGLVSERTDLVLIPEILYDSSKRSGVEILEFAPIPKDELNSCRSKSEDEFFNNDFEDNFNTQTFEDNYDMPLDDMNIDDFASDTNETKIQVKEFFLSDSDGIEDFESIKEEISDMFQSNYFIVSIKSDYLDSLKFLNYLQEYKMAILPYCFEPQMKTNNMNEFRQNNSSSTGQVNARIIINVPIYKEK